MPKKKSPDLQVDLFDAEPDSNMYEYKARLDHLKDQLLKFGLTANQAKVYIFLGKYGSKSAPEVFRTLGLPRTETYFILNTLQNQGIVTAELTSPQKFSAIPVGKAILTLVNTQKEKLHDLASLEGELTQLWDDIPAFAVETSETKTEKIQMVSGSAPINSKIKEMIKNAREKILIFGTEKDLSRFYHADILEELYDKIIDKKIIISPSQTLPRILEEFDRKTIKIMPQSQEDNQCFIVKDNDEILFFLRNSAHPSHTVFALWAESKALISTLQNLFEYSWNSSEVCY
jgi:HTH-type transcriptional regulator, sugar sensing transcriptional regulator